MLEFSRRGSSYTMANVVITGASRGLGLAMARELAGRGHMVFGGSRNPEELGDGIEPFALNVRDEEQVSDAIWQIGKARPIDMLINNAGIHFGGALADIAQDDFKHVLDVNLLGAWRVTRAALPHMREGGSIAMISSLSGLVGLSGDGAYAASKFALEGMSQSLAEELQPRGIKLALIEPGAIATGFAGNKHGAAPEEFAVEIADILEGDSDQLHFPVGDQARQIADKIGLDRSMPGERLGS